MIERDNLHWRKDGDGLALCRSTKAMVRVVPDDRWPGMWRVRRHDGRLTDMVNLTRAKDAAMCIALADLNCRETCSEVPYAPAREEAATTLASRPIERTSDAGAAR